MKKLIVLLGMFLVSLPLAAQSPYYLEYPYKDAEKRYWFGVEVGAAAFSDGVVTANAVFDYDVAECFALGVGAGVAGQVESFCEGMTSFGQAFIRFKFDNKAARVSPVFFQDVGIGFQFYSNFYSPGWYVSTGAVTNTVLGARFRLRNGDKLTIGGSLYTHWLGDTCMPLRILFGVHCGYSF